MSPPEILVHVAAPSRGVDDARYRTEARGILAFQSISRYHILTLDDDHSDGRYTQIQEEETSSTSQQNPGDSNETYDPTPQRKVYQAFDRWATAFPPPVQETKGDSKQIPPLPLPGRTIWSRPRVLIERTPADTRPRTAPSNTSVVQETPLLRRSLSDSFEASLSLIPDSQPAPSSGEQGQSSPPSPTDRTTQDTKPNVQNDHPSTEVEQTPQARSPPPNIKGKRKDLLSTRQLPSSSRKRRRLDDTTFGNNSAVYTTKRVALCAPSAQTSSISSSYSSSPQYHVSPSLTRQAQNDRTSEKEKLALEKAPFSPKNMSKRKEGVPIVGTLAAPEPTTPSRLRRRLSDTCLHSDLSPKVAAHIQIDDVSEKDKSFSLEDSLLLSRRRLGISEESTQEISTGQEHLSPGKKHRRRRRLSKSSARDYPVSRLSKPLSSKDPSSAPGSSSPLAAPPPGQPSLLPNSAPVSSLRITSRRHSIHPPPPPTSLSTFTTHRTPTLAFLLNTCSSHARISSYLSLICPTRAVHPLERGYWVFEYACERPPWSDGQAGKMRAFLEEVVGSGRAGWGVWCLIEKVGAGGDAGEEDVSTCATEEGPTGKEQEKAQGEEMERVKVYCWGEVVKEIWLVLFLASGRHIKGRGARWVDSGGMSVIRMT